jgi:hypothetical protein
MFLGAMLGGSYYLYNFMDNSGYDYGYGYGGFSADLLWGYDFGLVAGQAEILLTGDAGWYDWQEDTYIGDYYSGGWWNTNYYSYNFSGTTIQIPVMVKLDLHWRRILFQPQAGFYLNMALGDMKYEDYYGTDKIDYRPPLFGLMFGGAVGVRIGSGYLFLDTRYAMNLGYTEVAGRELGKRNAVMWNFGYQYYFKSNR